MKPEKRRDKRLDLAVKIEMQRLDEGPETTIQYLNVDVTDLSRSGMGFKCDRKLELNSIMKAEVTIWTKETLHLIFKIIREKPLENGFFYGSTFVGMNETDAQKIDIYELFQEAYAPVEVV